MIDFLKKNWSITGSLLITAIAIAASYYVVSLKKSKYSPSTFVSLDVKWGVGDSLQNHYNSQTSIYTYLDDRDKLIIKKVPLHINEVIFLDSQFNEAEFWSLPNVIANRGSNLKDPKVLRFEITIAYEKETKKIIYLSNYDEDSAISSRAETLQKQVMQVLNESEQRYTPD